jgi:hypothetical protein
LISDKLIGRFQPPEYGDETDAVAQKSGEPEGTYKWKARKLVSTELSLAGAGSSPYLPKRAGSQTRSGLLGHEHWPRPVFGRTGFMITSGKVLCKADIISFFAAYIHAYMSNHFAAVRVM